MAAGSEEESVRWCGGGVRPQAAGIL